MKNLMMLLAFVTLAVLGSGCSASLFGRPMVTGGFTGSSSYGAYGGVGAYGPSMVATPSGMVGTRPYAIVVNVSNYYGRDPGGSRSVSIIGLGMLRPGRNEVRVPDAPSAALDLQCSNGTMIHRDVSSSVTTLGYTVISDVDCGWGYY